MRNPRNFLKPLTVGAPAPFSELPIRLERVIHFVPPHIEKVRLKVPNLVKQVDVVLGNLEDGIPIEAKEAARDGFIEMANSCDFGSTELGVRINGIDTPFFCDDVTKIMAAVGNKLNFIMLPKANSAREVQYLDQYLAQQEAKYKIVKPILIHGIMESASGVRNIDEVVTASPRMCGMSLGPADLAASLAMQTTQIGGGNPDYKVPVGPKGDGPRLFVPQDLWHFYLATMISACAAAGVAPFYGPFGDLDDPEGCEAQFLNAFLMGCVGAWSLGPSQIEIAKRVFSPDPAKVAFARRIIAAMPDGSGVVTIEDKMYDDASCKQANVMLNLASLVVAREPGMAAKYGM